MLVAAFSIKAYFFPSEPITFERSLKVDIIALPQKRTTPAKPATKPQPKKVVKKAAKKPVKNQDLWQQLDSALGSHEVDWHWVKGHSGHEENERADQLANKAIDEMLERQA